MPEGFGDAALLLQVLPLPTIPMGTTAAMPGARRVPGLTPLPAFAQDFSERYVRTGAGQISGGSGQSFLRDGRLLRAHCNHTIVFDPPVGPQPPRVQQLRARAITASYDPAKQELRFQLRAWLDAGEQGSAQRGDGDLWSFWASVRVQRPCPCSDTPHSLYSIHRG